MTINVEKKRTEISRLTFEQSHCSVVLLLDGHDYMMRMVT